MTIWGDDGTQAPYMYAARIEQMRTRAERAAALAEVPEHLREMVRSQVVSDLETINAWARRRAAGLSLQNVPECVRDAAAAIGVEL